MIQEIKQDLINDLNIRGPVENVDVLADGNSRFLKDLRVNFKNVLKSPHINDRETSLLGLALAVNAKNKALQTFFKSKALELGGAGEEIAEATACASLLAGNNVLYRFRHFAGKEKYNQMSAGIKMNIMLQPVLGKELFELISLAVSAANGCQKCVNSHEQSLVEMGTSDERIFDAIRLASVVASMDRIVN